MNSVRLILKNPLVITLPFIMLFLVFWQQYTHAEPIINTSSTNIMKNNDFHDLDASGLPTGWQLSDSTLSIATSTSDGTEGFRQLKLDRANESGSNTTLTSPATDITAGDPYFYKGFYKSDLPFDLLLRTTDQDGSSQQKVIGHYTPSEQWTTVSHPFIADKSAKDVQLVYSFADKGSLQLGNNYLEPAPKDASPAPDKIDSQNLFSGKRLGDSELKSVDTTEGRQYRFGAAYRSDKPVDVVAQYKLSSGEEESRTIKTLLPAHNWTTIDPQYVETPIRATTIDVSLVQHGGGDAESKNYELYDITKSGASTWTKPYVSFTFDDGWSSVYKNGMPLLDQSGIKATFYIDPKSIDTDGFMSSDQVANLKKDGHELASHGYEHMDFTTLPSSGIDYQMKRAFEYFNQVHDEQSVNFAAPFGNSDAQLNYYVRKYYRSHRGTEDGINTKQNFNPYNLKALYIGHDTPVSKIENALQEAQASNGWLILIFHNVMANNTSNRSAVSPGQFQQYIDAVRQSGISTLSVGTVLDEIGKK